MSIEGDTSNFRAPEERNVYGRSESPQSKAPAGRHVYRVSYLPNPSKAPEGRHACRVGRMHHKSRKTLFLA